MADPEGFLKAGRELPRTRPVNVRIQDWHEVYEDFPAEKLERQASRCMQCGIPFCHQGCPLGNLIPEWNDLVHRQNWREASERLHATNNFPEFTGRICPAPCETACVLGISQPAVTIKQIEAEIADTAWDEGWLTAQLPPRLTGKTIAVVGSGPAGLAAAQQLARAGHTVAVFERDDRPGGLLRYGIPEFKLEKRHVDRRIHQLEAEGVKFRTGVEVGVDISGAELKSRYDAVVLATGATVRRELEIEGRNLTGVYQAMEYLPWANRVQAGDLVSSPIDARDKDVVIIGGGDTGADCLGTATRQGAKSVTQLEIMPHPPANRPDSQPWPTYPMIYRVSSAHEENGDRVYSVSTRRFVGDASGGVAALELTEVELVAGKFEAVAGSSRELPADLVFLAMGFTGPEQDTVVKELELELDARGNIIRDASYQTSSSSIFVAGDAGRGQSLVVWAIAEGRSVAAAVDKHLMGQTNLPSPIPPTARPLAV